MGIEKMEFEHLDGSKYNYSISDRDDDMDEVQVELPKGGSIAGL